MNKKIKVEKKDYTIKLKDAYVIDTAEIESKKELKLSLEESKDVEKLGKDEETEIKAKVTGKGKKTGQPNEESVTTDEVDAVIKAKKGWFRNHLEIIKVDGKELENPLKLEKSGYGDLGGLNYLGWGGIAVVLLGIVGGGYYWYTNSKKEEEEESI